MRYYLLKIEETLFGKYLLEKVYGSISHKKPTRSEQVLYHLEIFYCYQLTVTKYPMVYSVYFHRFHTCEKL